MPDTEPFRDRIDQYPPGEQKTEDFRYPEKKRKRKNPHHADRAYRRYYNKKKHDNLYSIATKYYVPYELCVDWDMVDGVFKPVGNHIKRPQNSNRKTWYKRYSNKKTRRAQIPTKGNGYRRVFDYWWAVD